MGICTTTLRNWVQTGIVAPTSTGPLRFDVAEIDEISARLDDGRIDRLRSRANKGRSERTIFQDPATRATVLEAFGRSDFSLDRLLFSVLIALARNMQQTKILQEELAWWSSRTGGTHDPLKFDAATLGHDPLGTLYQALRCEGARKLTGSYYTPPHLAARMVETCVSEHSRFLDPCCGTGQFLLTAADAVKHPEQLWGFDTDEVAVRIARFNLLKRFPSRIFSPNVFLRDGLQEPDGSFDAVATNPPWGAKFEAESLGMLRKQFDSKSSESFIYFLHASLDWLRSGGKVSLLLPESFLSTQAHQVDRRAIFQRATLSAACKVGRIFRGVYTPVVQIDLIKEAGDGLPLLSSFANDADNAALAEAMYAVEHHTLADNADWALGIVTGNNAQILSTVPKPGFEPIVVGSDVEFYRLRGASRYVEFRPDGWHQVAPMERYRAAEKLVYRFISKDLVFAYDDHGRLTLNSANVVIPKLPGYSVKSALAFLNSKPMRWLYRYRSGSLKVLKSQLRQLPFPLLRPTEDEYLTKLVDQIFAKQANNEPWRDLAMEIDEWVAAAFSLDPNLANRIADSGI